jgi:ATP-binding cassette subfamily G (WHITE) protein 2
MFSRSTGTIVFSIHQPRYSIFKLFDTVMFMCQGQCTYHGPINNVVPYFTTHGYQCEQHENPTDFVLDILIGACRTPATLARLNDAYQQSGIYTDVSESTQQRNNLSNTENHDRHERHVEVEAAQTFQAELFYVLQRTLRINLRNPAIALSQIIVAVIVALLVGLVFYNMQKTTDPGIQNRHGAIFFIVVNEIFSSMTAIESLIQERMLFLHVSSSYNTNTKSMRSVSGICQWLLQN